MAETATKRSKKRRASSGSGSLITYGVFGFIAYLLFAKGKALTSLNIYPGGVQNIYFDGPTPVISLGIVVQNTSSEALTLNSVAANLFANNYQVGNVAAFNPQPIPGNSSTPVTLTVRLGLLGITNDIIRAVQFGNFTQDLSLVGNANVDNYQVPLDLTFKAGG